MNKFLYQGEMKTFAIPLVVDGAAYTPGEEAQIIFTMKRDARLQDSAIGVVQKTKDYGLVVAGTSVSVSLVFADTHDLPPGPYVFEVRVKELGAGWRVGASGVIAVRQGVQKEEEVVQDIHTTEPPIPNQVQGPAGTITIGSVSTGAPGTDAIVENVGTLQAAILNITLPRGNTGADSTVPGPPGTTDYNDLSNKPVAGTDFAPAYPRAIAVEWVYSGVTYIASLPFTALNGVGFPVYSDGSATMQVARLSGAGEPPYAWRLTGDIYERAMPGALPLVVTANIWSVETDADPANLPASPDLATWAAGRTIKSADITTPTSVKATGAAMLSDIESTWNAVESPGLLLKTNEAGSLVLNFVFAKFAEIGGEDIADGSLSIVQLSGNAWTLNNANEANAVVCSAPTTPGTLAVTENPDGILTPAEIGAATAAQGSLADTALQPTVVTKTTPVDADTFEIQDSAASGARKLLSFANLKTWLQSLIDAITTIAGAKTFSGQVQLTGQSATDANSAMTRGLADDRYSHSVADFDYSSNTVGASGSNGVWTWTPPSTAKLLRITLVAAGSGGGSGRCGAAGTDRSGGGGGASGGITYVDVPCSTLSGGALTITVGAGGAGGAAVSTPDTNGADGATGGDSSVADGTTVIASAANSGSSVPRGKGGTTTTGTAGSNVYAFAAILAPSAGGAGSNGSGATASYSSPHAHGGHGGGGLNTSNAIGRGGVTSSFQSGALWGQVPPANRPVGPTSGVDGGSGAVGSINQRIPVGSAGPGGNGGFATKGGDGIAGIRGAGGGGGGAGTNGTGGSGKGGDGGHGFVRIEVIN